MVFVLQYIQTVLVVRLERGARYLLPVVLPYNHADTREGEENKMTVEVTRRQLAQITGLSESHIGMLIKRGELPQGRKDGRLRLLPKDECLMILEDRRKVDWAEKLKELF